MALTYKRCLEFWAKRRGKDWKKVERDLVMRQQPDGVFHLTMKGWRYKPGEGYTKGEWPFCSVTKDDILTVLLDHRCDQTEASRLSSAIGCPVYLDATTYRNHEFTVRVHIGKQSMPLPYTPGAQFKVYDEELKREPDYLNPPTDVKLVKDKDMSQQLKRELDTIRKLTIGMARMGSFDSVEHSFLKGGRWGVKSEINVENINYAEPTAEDAKALFALGVQSVEIGRYYYTGQGYTQRSDEEMLLELRKRAAANGIKKLREHLYEQRNGFVKIPAKTN